MKLIFKIIISTQLIVLTYYSLIASDWTNICPDFDSTFNYLTTGTFQNSTEGWLIDWGQTNLYHTLDGGNTWSIQFHSNDNYFYDIWFINDSIGWAKLYNGIPFGDPNFPYLMKTVNGGYSWEKVINPPESAFRSFTFIDSLIGFAGGNNIICKTSNSAQSWEEMIINTDLQFEVVDIYFVDDQYGWLIGDRKDVTDTGIILNTQDGGLNWNVELPETIILQSLYFSDKSHGIAVGNNVSWSGVVLITIDGGVNWTVNILNSPPLNDVCFINNLVGWLVGDYGYILKTEDGGYTWEKEDSGTSNDLNKIEFTKDGNTGFIFGDKNTVLRYNRADGTIDNNCSDELKYLHIYPNYPNPFNSTTIIRYNILKSVIVKLTVYDINGNIIERLVNQKQESGQYSVEWNASSFSSGVYFYQIISDNSTIINKMVLVK